MCIWLELYTRISGPLSTICSKEINTQGCVRRTFFYYFILHWDEINQIKFVHNSPLSYDTWKFTTLSQINPIYIFPAYFFEIRFNIIIPHSPRSLQLPSFLQLFWPESYMHFYSSASSPHITSKALGQAQLYTWYSERRSPLRPCRPLSLWWKSSRIILWKRKRKRNLAEERFHHNVLYLTPNSWQDSFISMTGFCCVRVGL